ncbi:MAG: hypothetical protein ACYCPO_10735 [Acidobacteriaceae bacterium]
MNEIRARLRFSALLSLIVTVSALSAQEMSLGVPAGTPFPVQLGKHVPMKKGEPLDCRLLYPVYAENTLAIPAGSVVRGRVIALNPDRGRRVHSRLWGDFTPFHIPVVHFDEVVLPDGTVQKFVGSNATDGAPVLHLSTPAAKKSNSFVARQFSHAKQTAKDAVAYVTAPGRKDRLVQLFYHQLPYHPERIETATMWTVTLAQPLTLNQPEPAGAVKSASTVASTPVPKSGLKGTSPAAAKAEDKSAWHLTAYLQQTISSANEKKGNTFEAVVAEPIFAQDHTLAVPQGSVLVGTITLVKAARSFGRAGKLRFNFRELKFPGAASQKVKGTLTGADSSKAQKLQIDSEGGVQSQPQNRVIVPVVLTFLAGRALYNDGNFAGNATVASNGFGIVGRVVGIVSGSTSVAAGIGFYAAGLSVGERWLVHGQNVSFAKNTRIEVTTVPGRSTLPTTTPHQNSPERH